MNKSNFMDVNEKAKIHDRCLEYESDIWDFVEDLGDQRVINYESGRKEDLNIIIPILNSIIEAANDYKDYIRELLSEGEKNDRKL